MRGTAAMLLIGVVMLAGACETEDGSAQPDAAADVRDTTRDADSASHDTHDAAQTATAAEADAHAHAGTGEPRPLLAIMQQLGVDMTALTHGLMTDSAQLVAESAEAIADHAPIAPEDLARIERTLGTAMPEFERLDEEVHEASVRLHQAATAGDTEQVLILLNEVQRGCVACHTQFRVPLRTNVAR